MHANTRKIRRICVTVCAIPALAFIGATSANAATVPSADSLASAFADPSPETLNLINQERAKAGCPALVETQALYQAAAEHSDDMARNNFMDHNGSDGSTPDQRLSRNGVSFRAWAENISQGRSTPAETVAGWMSSPGHRANILNCSFTQTGLAVAQPGHYYTQVFVTP
jgi:uncharacterized protein YkwD